MGLLVLLHFLDLIGEGLKLSLKRFNFCGNSLNSILLGFDIGYSDAVDLGKLQVVLNTSSGEAGAGDYANCGTEEVLHCLLFSVCFNYYSFPKLTNFKSLVVFISPINIFKQKTEHIISYKLS